MNEEVKMLRSELALLKLQFSERVGSVENRLNILLAQEQASAEYQDTEITHIEEVVPLVERKITDEGILTKESTVTADEYLSSKKLWEESIPKKPSFITILIQTILSSFFDWCSPVTKIYTCYFRGELGSLQFHSICWQSSRQQNLAHHRVWRRRMVPERCYLPGTSVLFGATGYPGCGFPT